MAQQASMIKEIEAVIAHDEMQAASAVTLEEMTALKNAVANLKLVCNISTALAKHYESKNKPEPKEASFETDDPTETDEPDEPKDKPARTRKKKETASSNKQAPPDEEPIEEDDDLDFLE